jgi:hypothetical protein
VNAKRVERIWKREGLKVPPRQPKRGRLWLADGSCIRLRPERPNHVWSYDFVEDRTHDGRRFRLLNVLCTAPGSLDNRLRYAACLKVCSSHAARASSGLRWPFFSISHSAL